MEQEDEIPTRIVELPPCSFADFLEHMEREDCTEWTWSYIEMCARFGFIHSDERGTILARPVNSALSEDDLMAFNDLDPNHELASSDLTKKHDTWHILYASGDPNFFFSLCPYDLPKLSWHRNKGGDQIRTYDFQTVKRRFNGKKEQTKTPA